MKIKDIVTLTTTSITPQSNEGYHLYSLPSFDDNQKREELIGSEIQSNKYTVPDKCILFNKLNVRFKRVWRIDNNDYNKICSTEFLPLVVNESKVDYQYCYYILISNYITNYLCGQNANTSGSHKRIDPTDFLNIELPTLPAMEEQKRIGQLLFSLDQKIALNRAINDNLEAMAKQLYDYWFVQFDFPNEEGKPYKSTGGKMVWNDKLKREIPEGWSSKMIGEIEGNIVTGKTPSCANEDNFGGDIPFITIDDIRGNLFVFQSQRTLSKLGADSQSKKYLPEGSLCISCIGTIGVMGFVARLAQTNQQINSIIFDKEYNKEFSYFSLMLHFGNAKAKTGNVFANMNKEEFASIYTAYPSIELLQKYHEIVLPMFDTIRTNTSEILNLTKQRDELLPLLMNGQVSVNYHLANKNNVVNTLFRAKLLTLYKIGLNMSENLKLWDIIDSFVSGDWGNEEESPEAPCCVSCIRGADIVPICNSDFDNIPIRYISNRSFTTHCLQEGDIIVEKSGGSPTQSTGRVVYISKELLAAKHDIVCSNFCVAFRVKPEWNSLYIYYYLRNVYNAGVFFNFEGKTSGIKNLDIETAFRAIPIKAIAMETQISIATAISCLDKKIALNRAINDNLPTLDHSSAVAAIRLAA